MDSPLSTIERRLLERIQSNFPLSHDPYGDIGLEIGCTREEAHRAMLSLRDSGIIRRIGGSFVADKLGYTSTLVAASVDPARLEDFFRDLAANWRGWPGEKTYESLEDELLLKATSDCLGHTELEVRLTSGPPPFHWMLRAALLIEAGQLESIAKHVEEFFSAV